MLALDALRGLAAIAVLLIHIGFFSGRRWLAPFGYGAVDLFYIISGLVIGYAFERKLLAGMTWRRFMSFRLVRLYPCLLLGLLAGVVAQIAFPADDYRLTWRSAGHLLLLPDFSGSGLYPLNGVFWTLFFELVINAIHALFVRSLTTRRLAALTALSGAAWAAFALSRGDWGAGWNGGTFTGGIVRVCWGYGVGLLIYRTVLAKGRRLPSLPLAAILAAAALLLMAPNVGAPEARRLASVFVLLPLLVSLAAFSPMPKRVKAAALWTACISYPLYAIHLPLVRVAAASIHPTSAAAWAGIGVGILALATACGYLYDIPVRTWLRTSLLSAPQGDRSGHAGGAIETFYSPVSISRDLRAFLAGTHADLHRSAKIGWQLFRSDLRARRRKSVLGHLWLFAPALASAAICTLLQAKRLLALPATELPYPIFVLTGMLLWQTLSDAVQAPLQQLSSARQLITRTRIPHEAVVVAAGANVLLNAVARMLVLALVLVAFRVSVGPSALLVPIAFAALALLGMTVGLLVAPLGLLYEDVARAVPLALFVWLVVTPVLYPLPAQLQWLRLNPATPLIDAGRGWLLAPGVTPGFLAVVAAIVPGLLLALLLYRVCRPHVVARLA